MRRRHVSRRWRNVGPSSSLDKSESESSSQKVLMAWEGASRAAFALQTFARQTFGANVKCKTHLFWAAHLQNVPVQKVECKVCCKRLAALAFSPNVLHVRSKTCGCERSNVKSGLSTSALPESASKATFFHITYRQLGAPRQWLHGSFQLPREGGVPPDWPSRMRFGGGLQTAVKIMSCAMPTILICALGTLLPRCQRGVLGRKAHPSPIGARG